MATFRAQVGPTLLSTPATTLVDRKTHQNRATVEVDAYQKAPGVAAEEQKSEVAISATQDKFIQRRETG